MEAATSTAPAETSTAELWPGAVALERRAAAVERFRRADRDLARAAAERLVAVNEFRLEAEAAGSDPDEAGAAGARARVRFNLSPDIERRSVRAEFAAAARISEQAAETQLEFAKALCTELTATLAALRAGDISEYHARLIWTSPVRCPTRIRCCSSSARWMRRGS